MAETIDTERAHDTESDVILETRGLTKKFGEVVANDDISINVEDDELRSIIGPNGAGKTTFFNQIAGVLPATSGTVHFRGEDITNLSIEERSQLGIGRSYQSNEVFFDRTVFENVRVAVQTAEIGEFSFNVFSRARNYQRDRAEEILEQLRLWDERDTTAENLSHGDQRRLGIAVAIATDPDLLLLDEPTSGMGPEATEETAALIENIRNELGIAIILIEHDMSVVMGISDRITVLYNGDHIATGTPEEVRTDEAVQDAYLGGMKEEELDL
ncbi:ABC transporter ATP-binding protein (plasmid) [Natrinema zhouii]|uniref:ABC transporter ATP-binding protein n=1 Tax=Natrinema zhouii TaxID=1710539 RepID=UPI001CFFB2E8|nr:ABC transporter ATP-binding protein [Natrinema zhouii]UHQ98756.1 ABC transporter ATP-binding protein [Natrinema zhouii]